MIYDTLQLASVSLEVNVLRDVNVKLFHDNDQSIVK